MIVNQKFNFDKETGKAHLTNTFDIGTAKRMALEATQEGRRGKNIVPMGYIPPEMWSFNPWLIEANKARMGGDKAEFTRLVKKFFELFPAFRVEQKRKTFAVGG